MLYDYLSMNCFFVFFILMLTCEWWASSFLPHCLLPDKTTVECLLLLCFFQSCHLELRRILVHPKDLIWCRLQGSVSSREVSTISTYILSPKLEVSVDVVTCGSLWQHSILTLHRKCFFFGVAHIWWTICFPVNSSIICFSHTAPVPVCLSLPNLGLE